MSVTKNGKITAIFKLNMSNKLRAIKGVIWSGIERFSVQIIQFVITVILARILTPEDFGLVSIILVLMNILQVLNEALS